MCNKNTKLSAVILMTNLLSSVSAFAAVTAIPQVSMHVKTSATAKPVASVQTTRITREVIKNSPVTSVTDLLKQEQSIVRLTNNSGDNNQTAISIRGFGDNAAANSLILIDGFPLKNATLLAPNLNSIALSDIERIDIIQGSEGSLWGDQAVGGVVNIVTRHPEKFFGNLEAGYGSFDRLYYNALVGSKFSDGYFFKLIGFTNKSNNYREHNRQKNENLSLQGGLDYARGTVNVRAQMSEDTLNFPGGLTEAQYQANPRQAVNFSNYNHFKRNWYQVLNKHELNSDWILETRLAHDNVLGDGFIYTGFNRDEADTSLSPRLIGHIKGNKITSGYDGLWSRYHLKNKIVNERASINQQNIYAQIQVPLLEQVEMTLGGRYAWQENEAEKITMNQQRDDVNKVLVSEQGLAWHLNKYWQIFLRRDGNFRFPKANEMTWLPNGANSLQAQTGVSYESGLLWKTDRQKFQFSVFNLALQHEIAFDPTQTPTNPFGMYANLDPTRRRGVTVAESFSFSPAVSVDGQINYVDARFASGPYSGNFIPAVPALNANVGFTYLYLEHWRTKYAALYTGRRFASEDFLNAGRQLPAYWLNTVALQYLHPSWDISFEIANLFNQAYSTYTLYNPENGTNTYYPGAGRTYLLTIKTSID